MKEIEFTLNDPITYQDAGNPNVDCFQLFLVAPNSKLTRHCAILRQGFMRQILKYRDLAKIKEEEIKVKKTQETEEKEMDGQGMLAIIYMSDLDLDAYFGSFRAICLGGCVKTPNGKWVTDVILDKISFKDFERMLGEFLQNFIIGSD